MNALTDLHKLRTAFKISTFLTSEEYIGKHIDGNTTTPSGPTTGTDRRATDSDENWGCTGKIHNRRKEDEG